MRILVTGRNGQVGHELAKLAEQSQHEWLCLDRAGLDVTSQADVDRVIDDFKPNIVINATAYTAVDKAETERELATAVNEHGPHFLALACERNQAALLHISTDYVFSGDATTPYTETDIVGPTGHYGASKLAGEKAIAKHCSKHIILRTAWVFGAHGNNFVKTMIRVAQGRDTLGVVADQHGAPTSAEGIAKTLLTIAEQIEHGNTAWGIYHYSGTPYTTWFAFAEAIFIEAEKRHLLPHTVTVNAITTADYPTPAKRPENSRLDCSKIKHIFAIEADDWLNQLNKVLNESTRVES
ncbi:MAG: dTDP-4-dehydrorhamnose reductase [Pseudomonadota bacterium]|jgi:dTDP-4-dehydrorhamnose reductase